MGEAIFFMQKSVDRARNFEDNNIKSMVYTDYLFLIENDDKHKEEYEDIKNRLFVLEDSKNLNILEHVYDFKLRLARQTGDKAKEEAVIRELYWHIKDMELLDDEKMKLKINILQLLINGGFEAEEVLNDIWSSFEDVDSLPMPSKVDVIHFMPFASGVSEAHMRKYEELGEKLIKYAVESADKDIGDYERTLSTECVHERCRMIEQRINFIRRSKEFYDAARVKELFKQIIDIYNYSTLTLFEYSTRIKFLKELHSQLEMGYIVSKNEIDNALAAIKELMDGISLIMCVDLVIDLLDVCIKLKAIPMMKYVLASIKREKINISKLPLGQIQMYFKACECIKQEDVKYSGGYCI